MTGLDEFNELDNAAAIQALLGCCSSSRWANAVAAARPYHSIHELLTESDRAVSSLRTVDLRAALAGHPRIGDRRVIAGRSSPEASQSAEPRSAADGRPAVPGVAPAAGTGGLLVGAAIEHSTGWSSQEQSGVSTADEEMLRDLEEGNRVYERRFGHIYLACASGRTAGELLALLRERLDNDRETEWGVVAAELAKINRIRLRRLIGGQA